AIEEAKAKESAAASDAPAVATKAEATTVKAPMPGLILRIEVKEGQKVAKNQLLLIMEAMKMENEIYAPCEGVVTKISVTQGQQLQSDDDLLVIG
ncbi:MAG: acetyl-CoA carboxylase biotin carboxyl carrier protein subunit, partial [Spirochaetota bacterium]|nr:acetyl-CoA carboxylase biotin carboxyl carrier protein subunit [Spirochaetota bacterium]